MDQDELQEFQITPQRFMRGFEARNEFYKACDADAEIRAIGFDQTSEFPIKRPDFRRLQVALPPKEEQLINALHEVEVVVLKVTSPNWEKEDRQRKWKGRDSNDRERHFWIEDEDFWHLVAAQKLNPSTTDKMKVQWAYIGDKRSHARVLKVLEYNGHVLGNALDSNALNARLGAYNQIANKQPDLFER